MTVKIFSHEQIKTGVAIFKQQRRNDGSWGGPATEGKNTWKRLKIGVKGLPLLRVKVGNTDRSKAKGRKQTKKIPITFRCIKSGTVT